MADIVDQIQQDQVRESNAELARARHDYNWNATFGRIAPENVLREARNMTALINNAIEKKMQLAAQTDEEAQRIFINDQKFKAWQEQKPLQDDLLRARLASEKALEGARTAREMLDATRKAREAEVVQHSALAQWEMDQVENSAMPESEKRAWMNTIRGKYPSMDKDTVARHTMLHKAFNPTEKTDDEKIAFEVARKKALDAAEPAKDLTPYQRLMQSGRKVREHENRLKAVDNEEESLVKDNPWVKTTTGPFKDEKTGTTYFGMNPATDTKENLRVASGGAMTAWNRYQELQKERAAAREGLNAARQEFDSGLAGDEKTANPSSRPDITPEAHAALKPGEKFFFKGKEYIKK